MAIPNVKLKVFWPANQTHQCLIDSRRTNSHLPLISIGPCMYSLNHRMMHTLLNNKTTQWTIDDPQSSMNYVSMHVAIATRYHVNTTTLIVMTHVSRRQRFLVRQEAVAHRTGDCRAETAATLQRSRLGPIGLLQLSIFQQTYSIACSWTVRYSSLATSLASKLCT